MTTAAEIVEAALKLPEADRLEVLRQLQESVVPPGTLCEGDPGFFEELDRRVDEHEKDPSTAMDWETVQAQLAERFGDRPG